jgi:hypothetical protein
MKKQQLFQKRKKKKKIMEIVYFVSYQIAKFWQVLWLTILWNKPAMEQERKYLFSFVFFPLFCEIIFFDPDWKRRFKNNSKNILDICTGTEFSLWHMGQVKKNEWMNEWMKMSFIPYYCNSYSSTINGRCNRENNIGICIFCLLKAYILYK